MVGTNDVIKFSPRETGAEIAHRVDGKRRWSAPEFLIVHFVTGVAGQAEPEPAQAFGCGGGLLVGLERRLSRGNKDNTVQLQLFEGSLGHQKMPAMHRVK